MSNYDRDIFKAIAGHSKHGPIDLRDILAAVDARQFTILNHDELAGGLARLIEAGLVVESGNFRYELPKSPPAVGRFSGVPRDEYDRACKAYHELFQEAVKELDSRPPSPDDHTRQKIVVRWRLPRKAFPTDADEDAMEPLIDRLSEALDADGRAEVNGCECGEGSVDILIFGKETDCDTDDLYAIIRPIFQSFPCPPGSCIIRQYKRRKRAVTSDKVPAK